MPKSAHPVMTTPEADGPVAKRVPNLVKLFTAYGPVYIDTKQLARRRTLLTIYTARGNRLKDVGRTREIRERAEYGVHIDNLYATPELAVAAAEAAYAELPKLLEMVRQEPCGPLSDRGAKP